MRADVNEVLTADPGPASPVGTGAACRRTIEAALAEILEGEAPTCRPRASSSRCARRARPSSELAALVRTMLRFAEHVDVDDADGRDRHVRDRWRPFGHGQRLDDGRARRGGRRRAGRQARQPGRVVAVRLGRRARGARCRDRARSRRGVAVHRARPASGSASRRASTRRCASLGPARDASSACRRRSTSSVRSRTRRG